MLTLDQYIIKQICKYPSLFVSNTYEESKIKVLDQLLNVIGNGIDNNRDLAREVKGYPNPNHTMEMVNKYINEKMYTCYTSEKPNYDKFINLPESELINHPEIKVKYEIERGAFNPYPGFAKKYSLVWTCSKYITMGDDWINGAIDFYTYCNEWFKNYKEYAHPSYLKSYECGIKEYTPFINETIAMLQSKLGEV